VWAELLEVFAQLLSWLIEGASKVCVSTAPFTITKSLDTLLSLHAEQSVCAAVVS
jgi:hypothetical protein